MLGSKRGSACSTRGRPDATRASSPARSASTVDPDVRTGSLSLGQQQHIEIIKALWKGSRVLILDEPTSMLTPQGIAELQKVLVARSRGSGLAIIFITHKLHEAIAIGDRVAVLKRGRRRGRARAGRPSTAPRRASSSADRRAHVRRARRAQAADVAELREAPSGHAPRRTLAAEPPAGAGGRRRAPGAGRDRRPRRVARRCAGRDRGRRRRRRQRPAGARGGHRRPAPDRGRRHPARSARRSPGSSVAGASGWACATSPTTGSARASSGR